MDEAQPSFQLVCKENLFKVDLRVTTCKIPEKIVPLLSVLPNQGNNGNPREGRALNCDSFSNNVATVVQPLVPV